MMLHFVNLYTHIYRHCVCHTPGCICDTCLRLLQDIKTRGVNIRVTGYGGFPCHKSQVCSALPRSQQTSSTSAFTPPHVSPVQNTTPKPILKTQDLPFDTASAWSQVNMICQRSYVSTNPTVCMYTHTYVWQIEVLPLTTNMFYTTYTQ